MSPVTSVSSSFSSSFFDLSDAINCPINSALWNRAEQLLSIEIVCIQEIAELFSSHVIAKANFFAYVKDVEAFLLKKNVPKKQIQFIKLIILIKCSIQPEKELDSFLDQVANEFQGYPFVYWIENHMDSLRESDISHQLIYDRLSRFFIAGDWKDKLDYLLFDEELKKYPLEVCKFLRFLLEKKKVIIEWTPEREVALSIILNASNVSFEKCSFYSQLTQSTKVHEILLRLLIEAPHFFNFFRLVSDVASLKGALMLSKNLKFNEKPLKETYLSSLKPYQSLVELKSAVTHFRKFINAQDLDEKSHLSEFFLKSILFTWQSFESYYSLIEWECFFNRLKDLKIADSFSYLSKESRCHLFSFINSMQTQYNSFELNSGYDEIIALAISLFDVDSSYADACAEFFVRKKVSPLVVSLLFNRVKRGERQNFITAIAQYMMKEHDKVKRSHRFECVYAEVLIHYAKQTLSGDTKKEIAIIFQRLMENRRLKLSQNLFVKKYFENLKIVDIADPTLLKLVEIYRLENSLTLSVMKELGKTLSPLESKRTQSFEVYQKAIRNVLQSDIEIEKEQKSFILLNSDNPEECCNNLMQVSSIAHQWIKDWDLEEWRMTKVYANTISGVKKMFEQIKSLEKESFQKMASRKVLLAKSSLNYLNHKKKRSARLSNYKFLWGVIIEKYQQLIRDLKNANIKEFPMDSLCKSNT